MARIKKSLPAVLTAILLVGGMLTAVVAGAPPAGAAVVVNTIAVGRTPSGVSSDGAHVWGRTTRTKPSLN